MKKQPKQKKIQRNIYFSEKQMMMVHDKADSLGLGVNEWIKYVVTREVEPLRDDYRDLSIDEEVSLLKELGETKSALKKGKAIIAESGTDLINQLNQRDEKDSSL